MHTPCSDYDLLIVGAGYLGSRVARQWRHIHPAAVIVAETRTDSSHSALRDIGATPALAGCSSQSFPYVVFTAPPYGNVNYHALVEAAAKRAQRRFVFTSSTSVYGSAKSVTENTPTSDQGRGSFLFHAEAAALRYDVSLVLRLTGLYSLERGPQVYWRSKKILPGNEKARVNVVHYDDAASAVVRALCVETTPERRVFLIGAPETPNRAQILECLLQHPVYKGIISRQFENDEPYFERHIDGDWSNRFLDWRPVYSSLVHFLERHAARVTASSAV
ncbi:NAD(P)-binding [Gracilaria domingensis]|nr:NAD(P)-binding [Gracilaria domingensis]